jgi:D-aminopeptidase
MQWKQSSEWDSLSCQPLSHITLTRHSSPSSFALLSSRCAVIMSTYQGSLMDDDEPIQQPRSCGKVVVVLSAIGAVALLATLIVVSLQLSWGSAALEQQKQLLDRVAATTEMLAAQNQQLSQQVQSLMRDLERCNASSTCTPSIEIVYQGAACAELRLNNTVSDDVTQQNTMCPGVCSVANGTSHSKPRARQLGVPFDFEVGGQWNAITDVGGVLVGHVTAICSEGRDAVRSGVTAVLPRGIGGHSVSAGFHSLSGNGELTGTHWITESGCLSGPILLTTTASVGAVMDAVTQYSIALQSTYPGWFNYLPVVGETWGGALDSMDRLNVRVDHVVQAIECAASGAVAEGSVGGGTAMRSFAFKSGSGSASRSVYTTTSATATPEQPNGRNYTIGVLVQSNFGARWQFTVAGVPVGQEIQDLQPILHDPDSKARVQYDPDCNAAPPRSERRSRVDGSFVCIIATDAPLRSVDLQRLAKRATLGYSRVGGSGSVSSGDLFLAFSTTSECVPELSSDAPPTMLNTYAFDMTPFFTATIDAVQEAILNSMMAADDMVGVDGNVIFACPQDRLQQVLRKYNRCNC